MAPSHVHTSNYYKSYHPCRYLFGWNTEFAELKRTSLKWADGKVAKAKWSAKQLELLGPETAEDKAAKAAGKGKVKKPKVTLCSCSEITGGPCWGPQLDDNRAAGRRRPEQGDKP